MLLSLTIFACSEKEDSGFHDEKQEVSHLKSDSYSWPDGTYSWDAGNYTVEATYEDGILIRRLENGEPIDISLAPKQERFYGAGEEGNEKNAMAFIANLEKNNCPCISAGKSESSFSGEIIWIVDYDYNTPCWYEKYWE